MIYRDDQARRRRNRQRANLRRGDIERVERIVFGQGTAPISPIARASRIMDLPHYVGPDGRIDRRALWWVLEAKAERDRIVGPPAREIKHHYVEEVAWTENRARSGEA